MAWANFWKLDPPSQSGVGVASSKRSLNVITGHLKIEFRLSRIISTIAVTKTVKRLVKTAVGPSGFIC